MYRLFPPLTKLPDELGRLYGLARAAHLELLQGEYRLEGGGGPLTAYRIALPLRGPYPRIREFLQATLETMPIASIDALQFERKKVTDDQLQAQLRLTLYFRSGGQIATGETTP